MRSVQVFYQTLIFVSAGAGGGAGGAWSPISLRYLRTIVCVKEESSSESITNIAPPHGQHAEELGACSSKENGAGNHRIFFHEIGQRFQAFSLISERIFDGFEIVSGDGDRNSGDDYKMFKERCLEE
jgi:hypothetical protein